MLSAVSRLIRPRSGHSRDLIWSGSVGSQYRRRRLALGTELCGDSGCLNQLAPLPRVSDECNYVMTTILKSEVEYQMYLQSPLLTCPNLRVLVDAVPQHHLFVYDYMAYDLLELGLRDSPAVVGKRILRDALTGLAALHRMGIVHANSSSPSKRHTLFRIRCREIKSAFCRRRPSDSHQADQHHNRKTRRCSIQECQVPGSEKLRLSPIWREHQRALAQEPRVAKRRSPSACQGPYKAVDVSFDSHCKARLRCATG